MQTYYGKLKSEQGGFAATAWIALGVYAFAVEPAARFVSWQAAVYFIVGTLAATLAFGGLFYLLTRGLSRLLKGRIVTEPTARASRGLVLMGLALMLLHALAIYFVARWVVRALFRY